MVLSSHSSLASEIMEDPILEMSQVLTVMGIEIIGPLSPFGRASSQFKSKHKFYFCSQHHLPPVPGWVSQGCGRREGELFPADVLRPLAVTWVLPALASFPPLRK